MSKNKNTIYAEDILKKIENWLKRIIASRRTKKFIGYGFIIVFIVASGIFYNMFKSSEEVSAWPLARWANGPEGGMSV